jgi:hypothetical protein
MECYRQQVRGHSAANERRVVRLLRVVCRLVSAFVATAFAQDDAAAGRVSCLDLQGYPMARGSFRIRAAV